MAAEFFIGTGLSPGMLIRLERVRRCWRQIDLADAAGVTQAEISAFERGLSVIPVVRARIYRALQLDLVEG